MSATDASRPERDRFLEVNRALIRRPHWGHYLRYIATILPQAILRLLDRLALPAGARLLDFGCADQPYRRFIPDAVQYVGADLRGNAQAQIEIEPDGRLHAASDSFDAVLSTQVLEHVGDPSLYLAEALRVLRPGGRLLITTHGMMVLHRDPVDYWRWTSDGLRHALEQAGFSVLHFEGIMGLGATGVQFFQDATAPKLPQKLRRVYCAVLQWLAATVDRFESDDNRALNALVYAVIAQKPLTEKMENTP